ncbi:hypothetical protein AVA65_07565 [Salmonella enterica subsp. enterica serovar Minnesota]|nr:hypothetical protein [Salmonella enterica subsp. enterica serovar Minnesota]
MSLPSRQLFLDRFMEVNRIRYKNDPEVLDRLNKLTVQDIVFEGLTEDPNRPEGMISNFSVPAKAIEAYAQRWIPVNIKSKHIIDPANVTSVPTLADVIAAQARGLFTYQDNGSTKLAIVMAFRQDIPVENLAKEVTKTLNRNTNYILKDGDLQINFNGSTDDYRLFDIRNETISGEVAVIRLPSNLLKGSWWLGYLGEWAPDEVIRPSILAEMVGVPNGINPDVEWLKFSVEGKIIYVAKRPISRMVSYSSLAQLNLVNGDRIVDLNGDQYKLRLLSGDDTDTSDWNRVMYRVSEDDPTGTFWEEFTDEELGVNNSDKGGITLTNTESGNSVYGRGRFSITSVQTVIKTGSSVATGWRPVLEFVGVDNIEFGPQAQLTAVIPVEPLMSGEVVGDYVYAVGPVASRTTQYTDANGYRYDDIVYTIQGVNVSSNVIVPATDLVDYRYVAVFNVLSVGVKRDSTLTTAEISGSRITDVVIINTLGGHTLEPAWLDPDCNQAVSDGISAAVARRGNVTLLPASGYGNTADVDSTKAATPKKGTYVVAADFVIEEITFNGIDNWIPETDYGDLFEEEAYNPDTTFMSF